LIKEKLLGWRGITLSLKEGNFFRGYCPNKNSFERSLKRFRPSEKGFGQQAVKILSSASASGNSPELIDRL